MLRAFARPPLSLLGRAAARSSFAPPALAASSSTSSSSFSPVWQSRLWHLRMMSTLPIFVRLQQTPTGGKISRGKRRKPKLEGKPLIAQEFAPLEQSGSIQRIEDDPKLPHGLILHVRLNEGESLPEEYKDSVKLPAGVPRDLLEKLLELPQIEDFAVVSPVELDSEKIAAALDQRARRLLESPADPPYDSFRMELRGARKRIDGLVNLDFQATAVQCREALEKATQLPLCRKKNQADTIKNLDFFLEQQKKKKGGAAAVEVKEGQLENRAVFYHDALFCVECGSEHAWLSDSSTITSGSAVANKSKRQARQKEHHAQERVVYMTSFGELYLKKGNQARMVAELMSNAQSKLESLVSRVYRNGYFIVFEPAEAPEIDGKVLTAAEVQEGIETRLACVPGIDRISRCLALPTHIQTIVDRSVEFLMQQYAQTAFADQDNRFHLQVRFFGVVPVEKSEPEIKNMIISAFLRSVRAQYGGAPGWLPPRPDSDKRLEGVSVRLSGDVTYIRHGSSITGVGGQAAAQGRYSRSVVALLSGGFDSPVASWLMMKRGLRVHLVHFQNVNTLSQDAVKNKIVEISRILSRYQVHLDLYIVPFTEMQARIIESVPASSRMVVYRRFMMKIAGEYAKKHHADFLVLGDAINQVASQTPDNLAAMYRLSEYPVLPPLIGLDKEEILNYARRIGTYEVSALPYGDCCSYFLAKHPLLECKVDQLREWEKAVQDTGVLQRTMDFAQHIRFSGWEQMNIRNKGRLDHFADQQPEDEEMVCLWERKSDADALEQEDMAVNDAEIAQARMEVDEEEEEEAKETEESSAAAAAKIAGAKRPPTVPSSPPSPSSQGAAAEQPRKKLRMAASSSSSSRSAAAAATTAVSETTASAYLDNAATTPVLSQVLADMLPFFASPIAAPQFMPSVEQLSPFVQRALADAGDVFANPHSTHGLGARVQKVVHSCRQLLADALSAPGHPVESKSIYFTSGGTEGNNMAIQGVARFARRAQPHQTLNVVTTALEHDSVLKVCQALGADLKIQVKFASVDAEGLVNLDSLRRAIDRQTILVSVMHANNEIGTVQPLREIHEVCQERGVLLHTDACQSFTKLSLRAADADIITLNAHKIHGPKGVGAVYLSEAARIKMDPLMIGGGQESSVRSGTLNVPGIVGLASAAHHTLQLQAAGLPKMQALRNRLWSGIQEIYPDAVLNGPNALEDGERRLCNNLSVMLPGAKLEGEAIVLALSKRGVYCSTGSACSSNDENKASHVLTAIGRTYRNAVRSLRFSLSLTSTEEHVDKALEALAAIKELISRD